MTYLYKNTKTVQNGLFEYMYYIHAFIFQLLPAEVSLNEDIYNDKSRVYPPVIKVCGQTTTFHKAVDVELTYSNDDVANIKEELLAVGEKKKFSTELGLLIRQKETESECQKLNESTDVFIERPRNDQVKLSFSLNHFCKYVQIYLQCIAGNSGKIFRLHKFIVG